jgi:hypothetical protein
LEYDVKGKRVFTDAFKKRMTGDVLKVSVLFHYFPPRLRDTGSARRFFKEHGFAIVRELIPKTVNHVVKQWYNYLESLDALGSDLGPANGGQAIRRTGTDERMARHLYGHLTPLLALLLGRPIKPSYSFMGIYYNGADLAPHRDNNQCEYTMSIQIDIQPASVRYPIFVCEQTTPQGNWREQCHGTESEAVLDPGDGVILMGRFHTHRRNKLDKGARSTQLFLHHVNEEYVGELKAGGRTSGGGATKEKLIDGRELAAFTIDGQYGGREAFRRRRQ